MSGVPFMQKMSTSPTNIIDYYVFYGKYTVKTMYIFSRNKKTNLKTYFYNSKFFETRYIHICTQPKRLIFKIIFENFDMEMTKFMCLHTVDKNLEFLSCSARTCGIYHFCMFFSKRGLNPNFCMWLHIWMNYICVNFKKIQVRKV